MRGSSGFEAFAQCRLWGLQHVGAQSACRFCRSRVTRPTTTPDADSGHCCAVPTSCRGQRSACRATLHRDPVVHTAAKKRRPERQLLCVSLPVLRKPVAMLATIMPSGMRSSLDTHTQKHTHTHKHLHTNTHTCTQAHTVTQGSLHTRPPLSGHISRQTMHLEGPPGAASAAQALRSARRRPRQQHAARNPRSTTPAGSTPHARAARPRSAPRRPLSARPGSCAPSPTTCKTPCSAPRAPCQRRHATS